MKRNQNETNNNRLFRAGSIKQEMLDTNSWSNLHLSWLSLQFDIWAAEDEYTALDFAYVDE
jgi:hypothetical protein